MFKPFAMWVVQMNGTFKHCTVITLFALAWLLTLLCRVERHAHAKSIDVSLVPTVIGEWHMVSQDTTLGAKEEKFLDEVLIRTYQRNDGKTVMLAVAYGADQRKNFSIHLPEVCYKASGCNVTSVGQAFMDTPRLTLKQLLAKRPGVGLEAVQYWIVLDGQQVTSEFEKRLRHFYYSLVGAKDGGVLVRVSSVTIERDVQNTFGMQMEFLAQLYKLAHRELAQQLFAEKN